MKGFKLLGALFVGLIGLASFGYCGFLIRYSTDVNYLNINSNSTHTFNSVFCFYPSGGTCRSNMKLYDENGLQVFDGLPNNYFCVGTGYSLVNNHTSTCSVSYYPVVEVVLNGGGGNCSDCPVCEEQYTSEECQQEYSLMPISSCNSEYCGLNGLCPEYTGSTMSELYINGINHLGAPIININIPLEQARDYEYTGDTMNINLSGENNVDYEYMDNIIRTQNSKPNTVDFNNIISVLLPKFIPGLVIILFILFVFRFIKKIF